MIILTIPFKDNCNILAEYPQESEHIEYRLDYCTVISAIDWSRFQSDNILTYRDRSEGGVASIPDDAKAGLLKAMIHKSSSIIDCEYAVLKKNPDISIPAERLLLSLHTDCHKVNFIREFLSCNIDALYYKLAVSCRNLSEFDEIISMIPAEKKNRMILVPLHPLPVTLRLAYRLYGSLATYTFLKETVALHQSSLKLAGMCRIDAINADTEIYGIIGGEQVTDSLSVLVYNRWFARLKQNKTFLPIIALTSDEATDIVNWLQSKARIMSFAITMPFKRNLPSKLKAVIGIANSWKSLDNTFVNTDETAFRKALEFLKTPSSARVLILGTGATAETALHIMEQLRVRDVTIWNHHRLEHLHHAAGHGQHTSEHVYDLLINCTPFGFGEQDSAELLPAFYSLIDLPYGKSKSALVRLAESREIPYVDGFTFWKWQAIAQAEFFGLETGFAEFVRELDLPSLLQ